MAPHELKIIVQLPSGQGIEQGGWRWPGEDPAAFINEDVFIRAAKITEKGKLDGIFLTDIPGVTVDISNQPPQSSLDAGVLAALMAKATEKVGIVLTMSTSHNEPYTIARTIRSLDLVSRGRIGWNVVTTGFPNAVLIFFENLPDPAWKHARASEVWEAVLKLWGSWPADALILDKQNGLFADAEKIRPINFKGKFVSTKGPLQLPPSAQGMPPTFTAGGGNHGFRFAIKNADVMYNNPPNLEYAVNFWKIAQSELKKYGRTPDQFTIFNGIGVSVASSEREALEQRAKLDEMGNLPARLRYLTYMLGLPDGSLELDSRIPEQLMRYMRPNFADYRSAYAYELAHKGYTVREIIAHGPINYHPIFLGTPESIAEKFEYWYRAGVGKGFSVVPDSGLSSLKDFVEQVVPLLQKKRLIRRDYENETLRGHLGLPYRNGL